jgi:hypothetical protein
MTPRVKKILKNYFNSIDNQKELMTNEEYIHFVKCVIRFVNKMEHDNLIDKINTFYPSTHPIKTLRNIPIIFKTNNNERYKH